MFFIHHVKPAMETNKIALTSRDLERRQSSSDVEEEDEDGVVNDVGLLDRGFTRKDQRDMQRLGKRQELLRHFRPLSALSFTVLLQATWEYLLM